MRAAALVVALLALAPVAGATRHAPELRIELVASGFRQPVDVVAAPGEPGRLYVVERAGRVRVAEGSTVLRAPFLDIRDRVRSGGLLGLFSIAFSPRYRTDRRAYAMYSGAGGNVYVVELHVRRGRAHVARTLLRFRVPADPYAHVGGQLAFGPGGRLNVGIGDGLDPAAAQDPASLLGKIVRLDVDDPSSTPTLVALGLRNPWRFSFDRQTGDLFVGDVGEVSWEEIDVIRHGARSVTNFGWDAYEGRAPYRDAHGTPPPDAVPPLVQYHHPRTGCAAVIGGLVYRGASLPEARGRYFYGDTCSGGIWSIRADSRFPKPRREPIRVGQLASFGEDARGELYLVGRGSGAIFRLTDTR